MERLQLIELALRRIRMPCDLHQHGPPTMRLRMNGDKKMIDAAAYTGVSGCHTLKLDYDQPAGLINAAVSINRTKHRF